MTIHAEKLQPSLWIASFLSHIKNWKKNRAPLRHLKLQNKSIAFDLLALELFSQFFLILINLIKNNALNFHKEVE
jgi:hypothetical protein